MVLASLKKQDKDTTEDKHTRTQVMQSCKQQRSAWPKQMDIVCKQLGYIR